MKNRNDFPSILPILLVLAIAPIFSQRAEKVAWQETLIGGGATFPAVLYQKWFDTYHRTSGVKLVYKAVGSGKGLNGFQNQSWDFGASDFLPSSAEAGQFPAPYLEIPTCLGGVAVPFNLPGITELKFDSEVLMGIFSGRISKWNASPIHALNPKVSLPDLKIEVIHRSDASGTTFIFTEYLSKVNSQWAKEIGKGKTVAWPVGFGANGTHGVSEFMARVPGSIAYMEWNFAVEKKLRFASLRNHSGSFIKPELKSIFAAAEPLAWSARSSLTDTHAPTGYPIVSLTWILAYKEQNYKGRSLERGKQLQRALLGTMSKEAQQQNPSLGFGSLSPKMREKYIKEIKTMTFGGSLIIPASSSTMATETTTASKSSAPAHSTSSATDPGSPSTERPAK